MQNLIEEKKKICGKLAMKTAMHYGHSLSLTKLKKDFMEEIVQIKRWRCDDNHCEVMVLAGKKVYKCSHCRNFHSYNINRFADHLNGCGGSYCNRSFHKNELRNALEIQERLHCFENLVGRYNTGSIQRCVNLKQFFKAKLDKVCKHKCSKCDFKSPCQIALLEHMTHHDELEGSGEEDHSTVEDTTIPSSPSNLMHTMGRGNHE